MKTGTWIWGAVIVAVLGLGAWYFLKDRSSSDELKFDTAKVERGRIVARVSATGTLSALVTVQVGSQVSGRIASLHADFNTPVKKGQVLATIDPQLFDAALEQAKANYAAAQGNLSKAKIQAQEAQRQLERTKNLAERKLIAQADLDTAQSNALSAQAQIEVANGSVSQSRAALHQAEVNLQYTTILSPIDGVVISRSVDVGQTVAASLSAPTIFVIAEDLRKMQVDTSVAEADVGKLSAGMDATFTVDAYPSQRFSGKVRQIRNSPTTVQNVVTYDAVIDVDNPDLKLKPGMTANVTFIYAQKDDVLRIPNAALRFRPSQELLAKLGGRGGGAGGPGGRQGRGGGGATGGSGGETPDKKSVWVLRANNQPERVTITAGTSDGTQTEVAEGPLNEGDAVVTDITDPSAKPGGSSSPLGGPPAGGGGRRGGAF